MILNNANCNIIQNVGGGGGYDSPPPLAQNYRAIVHLQYYYLYIKNGQL